MKKVKMNNDNLISKKFNHVVLEGTSYEVGQQIAEVVKDNIFYKPFVTSGISDPKKLGFKEFKDVQAYMEEYCPGINDELQGVADGLGVNVKKIMYYDWILSRSPGMFNCTHFSILGRATEDHHVITGRSYEWRPEQEDCVLYTTRIKGKPKHIGFSTLAFGRIDGFNEYGLSVTHSGVLPGKRGEDKGFLVGFVIRSLLENCHNAKEALKFMEKVPVLNFTNLQITDKKEILIVECANNVKGFKKINRDSPEFYHCSANIYTLPETVKFNKYNAKWLLDSSKFRREIVEKELKTQNPKITIETIRKILSNPLPLTEEVKARSPKGVKITKAAIQQILSKRKESTNLLPEGVCGIWCPSGWCTVWSLIFDNTIPHVEVCFGPPTHNKWQTIAFDEPVGIQEFSSIFPYLMLIGPEIIDEEDFHIIGVEDIGNWQTRNYGTMWEKVRSSNIQNCDQTQGLAISMTTKELIEKGENRFIACRKVSRVEDVPEGMITERIPGQKYAVFTHRGTQDNLAIAYQYIEREWIPKNSKYELTPFGTEFEWRFEFYDEKRYNNAEEPEIDIYIPIREK